MAQDIFQMHKWGEQVPGRPFVTREHCGMVVQTALVDKNVFCNEFDFDDIDYDDFPDDVQDYAKFRGLKWSAENRVFIKPFSPTEYTIEELFWVVHSIKNG